MTDCTCPRCGASLPTVTVRYPVRDWVLAMKDGDVFKQRAVVKYETKQEPGECFRCTGSY